MRTLDDHKIIIEPHDKGVSRGIIRDGHWQRDDLENAISYVSDNFLLPPGGLFVDIGANIGTQTVYALLTGRFEGAVAVEVTPKNIELLRLNILINDFAGMVTVFEIAAGTEFKSADVSLYPRDNGRNSIKLSFVDGDTVPVVVAPFDDMIERQYISSETISFVWIDTEGYEPEVLEGMPKVLQHTPPLVIEWNANCYTRQEIHAMINMINEAAYRGWIDLRAIENSNAPEVRPFAALSEIKKQTDVLCIPQNRT